MIEETPGIAIVLTILIVLSCCVILIMCINCFLGICHGILKPMLFGPKDLDDSRWIQKLFRRFHLEFQVCCSSDGFSGDGFGFMRKGARITELL